MAEAILTKRCKKCNVEKPIDQFHKNKKGCKLGLHSYCIPCFRAYLAELAADPEHKKRASQRVMAYHKRHPEMKKKHKDIYYERHADRIIADVQAYRDENGEAIRERARQGRLLHPEKAEAKVRRRKTRIAEAEGFYTGEDVAIIRSQQGDRCAAPWCRCGLHGGGDEDHIVPLVRGGSNFPKNIQLLCHRDNGKKGMKDPIKWAAKHGYHIDLETKTYTRILEMAA